MATGRRAHAADRPAGIRPTDATIPLGMEAALSMARLGAKVNACGGTPTKRASALSLLRRFFASQGAVLDDSSCESARLAHPEWILCALRGAWPAHCEASRRPNNEASPMAIRVNSRRSAATPILPGCTTPGSPPARRPMPIRGCHLLRASRGKGASHRRLSGRPPGRPSGAYRGPLGA
jgi:hypothetical protein